ncbi:hypothetical protein AeMF1_020588 [Aphanomyces euteiches]|nr:hypothetical protein AeMF1_020588 [Aphanomyces euteiches]KAH9188908.1 hypothetical protein AeNC1_009116 [Aphanomyces euteiches]
METTMADEYDDYNEEEEVEEVEEMVDDIPMFITNRIYLGSIDAARNPPGLASKDIRMVISVLSPYDKLNLPDEVARRHVRVDLEDDYEEHLFSKLPYLLHCIERFLQEEPEGNILVHCIAGVSRSASIVAAYLMVKENLDPQAALNQIRLSRPWVDPNSHFLDHLTLFHQIHSHVEVESPILAAALNVELPSLPKLHFHSQFVHPIGFSQTKTLTIRLKSDKEDDSQSNLSSIYRFSTVVAVTEATEHFSFLHVTAVEHCTVDQLTLEHAQGEGLSSVADLMGVLDFFYPNLPGDAKVIVIHFRLVANIVKEDL